MHIKQEIAELICQYYGLPKGAVEDVVFQLTNTPDAKLGDVSFPCFALAKRLSKPPVVIAKELQALLLPDWIDRCEVAGPYLNFYLNTKLTIYNIISDVFARRDEFGKSEQAKGTIVIDFSHPNIAKPFHFGHLRSTNLGAILSRMLEHNGYEVFKKNYLGDWGTQFGFVIHGYKMWGDEEALKSDAINHLVQIYIKANKEAEEKPEVWDIARDYFRRLELGEREVTELWQRFRDVSVEAFMRTYRRLGVEFDSYEGEASISPRVEEVIQRFVDAGIAVEKDGALVVDYSDVVKREVSPLVLRKSDGSSTYGARDCAEALDRFERHDFTYNIYVVARQEDHFWAVFSSMKRLAAVEGWERDWTDACEVVGFGYVKGMSTRKGDVVWLDDVLNEAKERARRIRLDKSEKNPIAFPYISEDELETISEAVGQSAILVFDVSALRNKDITFDWESVLQFDGNTGPYLQYTYARIQGIFRKAVEKGFGLSGDFGLGQCDLLQTVEERTLLLKLEDFKTAIEIGCRRREPHEIARYAFELSGLVNNFYNQHRVLDENEPERSVARLKMLEATGIVLANVLRILGVKILHTM